MVDFPAPFGPSSAVTPTPIPKVRSETATTSPYHLATPRKATIASTPGGRPGSSFGIGSTGACFTLDFSNSLTTLIPGEHHRAADCDHCRHHSECHVEGEITA